MKNLKNWEKFNESFVANLDDVFYVGTKEEANKILDKIVNADTIRELKSIPYMADVLMFMDELTDEEVLKQIKEESIELVNREF